MKLRRTAHKKQISAVRIGANHICDPYAGNFHESARTLGTFGYRVGDLAGIAEETFEHDDNSHFNHL
ncbi:hypothetical protein GALL_428960 [mine drainage metagenome]|uniref:Uncharacterized protein n=1 Tax=mine drainage metagenome TaxID=410659 RepID=A0A1J5PVC8_9ZZZZ